MKLKLNCKETAQLISEGLDHFLPLHKRILIRIHLAACVTCRYYQRQVKTLKLLLRHCQDSEHLSYGPDLPENARQRMKSLLKG